MKMWVKKCLQGLFERVSFQRYDPRCHHVRRLCVPDSSLSCFSLSANNIKIVNTEDGVFYFREMICRSPLVEYLRSLLDDYFCLLHQRRDLDNFSETVPIEIDFPQEVKLSFERYVRRCQQEAGFYRALDTLPEVVRREGYSMWRPETRVTPAMLAEFGFPDCPAELIRVFPDFISFMKSGIAQYHRSSLAGRGGMDSFNACRSVATKLVADFLGLGRLIPDTEVVLLCTERVQMYGVLCSRCPGKRAKDAPWPPAPSLQRDLADLMVLDALCYQNDHGINNYNVYEKDGYAVGAMAFDNDNMWAFAPVSGISFASTGGGEPLLGVDGSLRLPHLSAETAQRVLACDAAALCGPLKPYLNALQRIALRMRLRSLQRAMRRTLAARADFLLADDAWTEQTLQEELNGAHGRTYTYLYATTRDCCAPTSAEH